jgi:hypothetical protein
MMMLARVREWRDWWRTPSTTQNSSHRFCARKKNEKCSPTYVCECTWLVIIIYRKSNGWKRLATYLTSIRILSDLLKLQFNRFTRIRLLGMNSPISNKPCRLSGVKKVKSSISHSKPACYIRRGAHGLLSEVDQTSPISILLRNLRRLFRWDDVTALLLGALWSHREVNATLFLRECHGRGGSSSCRGEGGSSLLGTAALDRADRRRLPEVFRTAARVNIRTPFCSLW